MNYHRAANRACTLLILVVACGRVLEQPPDASDPPSEAPVRVTTLSYTGDGQPDLAARMIFQDVDGKVVFEGPVDSNGRAEALLPTGGTVTALRIVADTSSSLMAQITTIVGVKPGDDLTLGFKASPTIIDQGAQTTMFANFTPAPGATNHHFFTTCGVTGAGTSSPVTLSFRDSCRRAAFDLLVVASGGMLVVPQFTKLTGVAYQNGQTFTVPGGYSTMGAFRVTAMNIPAEISDLMVTRSSMLEHVAVAGQTVSVGDPAAGTISVNVPFAAGVGTRSEVSLAFRRQGAVGTQEHSLHTATLVDNVTVNLSQQRVPWLEALAVTATGLTWQTVEQGDAPDGMVAVWSGRWLKDGRVVRVGWRIVHPSSATGLALPRLPPMHADVDPQAQNVDVTPDIGSVSIVDYDVVAGYDEFRQQPDTLMTPSIDSMGAFVGLPYQRRMFTATVVTP